VKGPQPVQTLATVLALIALVLACVAIVMGSGKR